MSFWPNDFVWGVATSAYQIEGARGPGRTGESIWDRFARSPGLAGGATGDLTCDHFDRYREDVALMAELGVTGYRFSIGWTRVIPDGQGPVSIEGLDFYDRLVDELLVNGITPYPTLYHWDLPQAVQDRGGWPNRNTVDASVRLTDVVTSALGDRVGTWITHNEPWVAAILGHMNGVHAPGIQSWEAALAAGHHLLLSHGRAAQAIRANIPNATLGIALDCRPCYPASATEADAAAPLDFLGLSYYTSLEVRAGAEETEDARFQPALRTRLGRPRIGRAHPQGQLPLVRRDDLPDRSRLSRGDTTAKVTP